MRHRPDAISTCCFPFSLMYDAQYLFLPVPSSSSSIAREMHSTVPVGFPPSHVRTALLPSSSSPPLPSDVINTPNDNASLPPLDPQSFDNRFVGWDVSSPATDSSLFLLPKSSVIFHLPDDHGDGDVLYCPDDACEDVIDGRNARESKRRRFVDEARPRRLCAGVAAHDGRWTKLEIDRRVSRATGVGLLDEERVRGGRASQNASCGNTANDATNICSTGAMILVFVATIAAAAASRLTSLALPFLCGGSTSSFPREKSVTSCVSSSVTNLDLAG